MVGREGGAGGWVHVSENWYQSRQSLTRQGQAHHQSPAQVWGIAVTYDQ